MRLTHMRNGLEIGFQGAEERQWEVHTYKQSAGQLFKNVLVGIQVSHDSTNFTVTADRLITCQHTTVLLGATHDTFWFWIARLSILARITAILEFHWENTIARMLRNE